MTGDTRYEDFEEYKLLNEKPHALKEFIKMLKGDILEVGCGSGKALKILQERGVNAEGFDISEKAIQLCKDNLIKNVQVSSIDKFNTKKRYDYILCFDTLYYLKNCDRDFKKLVGLLKKDGQFIVNFYNPLRYKDKQISVGFREFKRAIRENNMKIETVCPQSLYTGGIKSKLFCQVNVYILSKKLK
jgi:2-polyprenyl-3-methyl-5-hydroxy-6-metoxy-1,4-benzoquinol methylase